MKLFDWSKAKHKQNLREGIYEAAKKAHHEGMENRMNSSNAITEKLIDIFCEKLRNPEYLGRLNLTISAVQRTIFRIALDDDTLEAPTNGNEIDKIIRGVLMFFEGKGFNVRVDRFEKTKCIKEATISIRKADMVEV